MERLVIDRKLEALREFHRIGIPLDHALDCSVEKGHRPLIEALLNMGVTPSTATLLRAMRRGITIRNMFLDCVTPTVEHLNAAVVSGHFDTATLLLDRGVKPDALTVHCLRGEDKPAEDRKVFVGRLLATLDLKTLTLGETLERLPWWTSIAQFERALDRQGTLKEGRLNMLLTECLRAASPEHVRMVIRRGAVFGLGHFLLVNEADPPASESNPNKLWHPVVRTVLETAAEEGCLVASADTARGLIHHLVRNYALSAYVPEGMFVQHCRLIARASRTEERENLCQLVVEEIRQLRPRVFQDDISRLVKQVEPLFAEAESPADANTFEPGIAR